MEQLRRNYGKSIDRLEIVLDENNPEEIRQLAEAIRNRKEATYAIDVVFVDFNEEVEDEGTSVRFREEYEVTMFAFCTSLGSLPRLEKLRLWSDEELTVPVWALTTILSNSRLRLSKLKLVDVTLTGNTSQFENLATALRSQVLLKSFKMERTHFVGEPMDYIVEVLASLDSLETVTIDSGTREEPMGHYSPQSMTSLCSLTSLKTLRLEQLVLDSGTIVSMAEALQKGSCLEVLYLDLIGEDQAIACSALSQMLKENQTLQDVHIFISHLDTTREALIEMANALKNNRSLTNLDVTAKQPSHTSLEVKKAFAEMLKTNYTLEALKLPGERQPSEAHQKENSFINFYLRLNRQGRKRLFNKERDSLSHSEWVEFLVRCHCFKDLSSIFYCLQMNPLLCYGQHDIVPTTSMTVSGQKRSLELGSAAAKSPTTRKSQRPSPY